MPWFHNESASGEASSLLDPGGRGALGLNKRRRAGQGGVRAFEPRVRYDPLTNTGVTPN